MTVERVNVPKDNDNILRVDSPTRSGFEMQTKQEQHIYLLWHVYCTIFTQWIANSPVLQKRYAACVELNLKLAETSQAFDNTTNPGQLIVLKTSFYCLADRNRYWASNEKWVNYSGFPPASKGTDIPVTPLEIS